MSISPSMIKLTPKIEELTVTPTTSIQTINVETGIDGYGPVKVNAVTANIDSNIQPENIKEGVNILGITGTAEVAPEYYFELQVDISGVLRRNNSQIVNMNGVKDIYTKILETTYKDNNSITEINWPSLTSLTYSDSLHNGFNNSSITKVKWPNLTEITGNNALDQCFYNCINLTEVDFSSLTNVISSCGMYQCFTNCKKLSTISFPNLTKISGKQGLYRAFFGCDALTTVDMHSLRELYGEDSLQCGFAATPIQSVDLSNLTVVSGNRVMGGYNSANVGCFENCTNLTSLDLSKLVSIDGTDALDRVCYGCTSLSQVDFSSLKKVGGSYSLENGFTNTSLTQLAFPALTIGDSGRFNKLLSGVTNCTVHFPLNKQADFGSWASVTDGFGGTNTTVLFDLPSVLILTGVNETNYERNPKYDTATALAWRVQDVGTTIDWTPYYTSSTADPIVGATIYSDSTCTTAITTIDSIA